MINSNVKRGEKMEELKLMTVPSSGIIQLDEEKCRKLGYSPKRYFLVCFDPDGWYKISSKYAGDVMGTVSIDAEYKLTFSEFVPKYKKEYQVYYSDGLIKLLIK